MPDADLLFRTLADPTRRAIFERLCLEGERTVGALTEQAGVSQPAVSKHLAVLEKAGLITRRRVARKNICQLEARALAPLSRWVDGYRGFWEGSLTRLDAYLEPDSGHADC